MSREIERKFFVKRFPSLDQLSRPVAVYQAYLHCSRDHELRIRKQQGRRTLTSKSGGSLEREEWELPLGWFQFARLKKLIKGQAVTKDRFRLKQGDIRFEVDVYKNQLEGLQTVEIEFSSVYQAYDFQAPDWFGWDITYDYRFKNKNLALLRQAGNDLADIQHMNGGNWAVGALPFILEDQVYKAVTISTKSRDRMIFPKGQLEPGKLFEEVALMEAYEEAGVKGEIFSSPILVPYIHQDGRVTNILLYPVEVKELESKWPEAQRWRKTVSFDLESDDPFITAGLQYLSDRLSVRKIRV